jgi:lycopene beta-cyclase
MVNPPRSVIGPRALRCDYALVGGGLQNGLIALALAEHRPDVRFALIERASRLGGNHLWSFHAGDLGDRLSQIVEPMIVRRWPGYRVAFPALERTIPAPYASVSSDRFDEEVQRRLRAHPGARLFTGIGARSVEASRVVLDDGTAIEASVVIDARGPARFTPLGATAYQKFVGLELEVTRSLAGAEPVVMDARVPQNDGFRFFYVLPLDEHRVLVEDTYFSDTARLDRASVRAGIVAYAARLGWEPVRVVREEHGVIPLPHRWGRAPDAEGVLLGGYAGGWFHPTTGYSFPVAARLADLVASCEPEALRAAWARLGSEHARQARYASWLNRLLYGAFAPHERYNVLERFYRLPEPTIRRFYAMTLTRGDRARIVCGRPPRGLSLRFATTRRDPMTHGMNA